MTGTKKNYFNLTFQKRQCLWLCPTASS